MVLVQFGEIWRRRTLSLFFESPLGLGSCFRIVAVYMTFPLEFFYRKAIKKVLPLPLQVKPHDSRRLRAIELSVPNVIATFQVKHRNSDGVITDARVYNIDLNAGKVISGEKNLKVRPRYRFLIFPHFFSSAGRPTILPAGPLLLDCQC